MVDDDVNIDDPSEIEWAIATRFRLMKTWCL
ncbi:UbiD family decarboxylase [Vulcanisaeta distributa]|nr:UbiD family decarboxylase domain-containing protein [Vulcanisaeta distributa]